MKPELEKLARHRLARAKDAFGEGEQLLSQKFHMGAVNRFYYAAFYATRALLALQELDSSRHSGVISLFQKHFVKPGKFATAMRKLYREHSRNGRKAIMETFLQLQHPKRKASAKGSKFL